MTTWLLSTIAIAAISLAIVSGFRRGGVRQIPALTGFIIGAVSAHVFRIPASEAVMKIMPYASGKTESEYIYTTIGCGLVFVAVYFVFKYATKIIVYLFLRKDTGLLDGLAGALISFMIYITFLSLAFNLIVCLSPRSEIMRSVRATDGNIIDEVLMLSPLVTGSQSAEELSHRLQLEEASHIS